jgi:hypothetical protein
MKGIVNNPAYAKLINAKKSRSMGDPWVIAHAKVHGAIVVAEEVPKNEQSTKVKTPDVCKALNVPCIRTIEFLRAIGFSAK